MLVLITPGLFLDNVKLLCSLLSRACFIPPAAGTGRCLALDEHEPVLLIQELFAGSWICLKDMKQGCERENWLSCERCSERHPRAACGLNPPFLNPGWSKESPSLRWLAINPFILEKVGSLEPVGRAKGDILSGKRQVTRLCCLSSSLLQNKDNKT